MRRLHGALGAVVLGLSLAGCARLPFRPAPDVKAELVSVTAAFPTDETGEVALKLLLKNPGSTQASVLAVSWELWLDGRWFAAGTQGMNEALPPGETTVDVQLPLSFLKTPMRKGPQLVRAAVRGRVLVLFEPEQRREVRFERVSRIVAQGVPVPRRLADEEN
jgi:hypothetical protein